MLYNSTRGHDNQQKFSDVLMKGLAHDGGLFVPAEFPKRDIDFWRSLKNQPYERVAFEVMRLFVGDEISESDLEDLIGRTYKHADTHFRSQEVTPLISFSDNFHVLELFHGPTLAFKDVALQMLGRFFDHVLKERQDRITIVGATSGDTGSAAIEGCRHSDRADIFILYPYGRTSDIQRRQMTTISQPNVHCLAIDGSFDDCQKIVKELFADAEFRDAAKLSAINSINWARILSQIVYYVYAYVRLLDTEDTVLDVCVPTGNFGNIYAAYCAKQMGLPLGKLVIASNKNDILPRFIETGRYELGDVHHTYSPSMDIQISSNFERFLYDLMGRDPEKLNAFMESFRTTGSCAVEDKFFEIARETFWAGRSNDEETLETIKQVYDAHGIVLDPHTAVGVKVAQEFQNKYRGRMLSLACAHPAKFPDVIEEAIGITPQLPDFLADLMDREEKYERLPADTKAVKSFILANSSAS